MYRVLDAIAYTTLPSRLRTITDTNVFKRHLKAFRLQSHFHSSVSAAGQFV